MKLSIACLAALLALPAFADDASKQAKAQELMTLMNARQMQDQIFTGVKRMTAQQVQRAGQDPEAIKAAQESTAKVMQLVESRMKWELLEPEYVKLYTDTFTEPELDGIIAFYKSPAGRSMINKMPVLMQKSMAIAQTRMQAIAPEIEKIMKEGAAKAKPAK